MNEILFDYILSFLGVGSETYIHYQKRSLCTFELLCALSSVDVIAEWSCGYHNLTSRGHRLQRMNP